jgi:hypothetical protein
MAGTCGKEDVPVADWKRPKNHPPPPKIDSDNPLINHRSS